MEKIYLANFKMNGTYSSVSEYFETLLPDINKNQNIVCLLPFPYISKMREYFKNSEIEIGAQNVYFEEEGAFTGEVSAKMLSDCEVKFCIVGHSERRKYFNETNNEINKKIKQLMKYNIKSILCIGETYEERGKKQTEIVIEKQISECLNGIYENEIENLIIAYEPLWAIGTGKVASNKMIEEAIKTIRKTIAKSFNETIAKSIQIVYGGSVTPENIIELKKIKNLDGFLIGKASINAESFAQIINS